MKLSEILGEGKFKDLDLELQELGVRSSAARSSAFRVGKDCKTFEDFNKRVSHIGGLANLGANVLEKVWSTVRATQVREAKDEPRSLKEGLPKWEKHPTRKGVLYRAISPEDRARAKADEELKALRKKIKKNEEHRRKVRTGEKNLRLTDSDYSKIYDKIETAIGDAIPDGDPWDEIAPWFKRAYGEVPVLTDYLDRAIKKNNRNYKGYDDMLEAAWEEYETSSGEFPFKGKNNPWRGRD